jgi:UTP--glucose-1-phosphate uridylyltransferase
MERQKSYNAQAFENTSTNIAASQMRNALNQLADTVKDPQEKKVRYTRIQELQHANSFKAV